MRPRTAGAIRVKHPRRGTRNLRNLVRRLRRPAGALHPSQVSAPRELAELGPATAPSARRGTQPESSARLACTSCRGHLKRMADSRPSLGRPTSIRVKYPRRGFDRPGPGRTTAPPARRREPGRGTGASIQPTPHHAPPALAQPPGPRTGAGLDVTDSEFWRAGRGTCRRSCRSNARAPEWPPRPPFPPLCRSQGPPGGRPGRDGSGPSRARGRRTRAGRPGPGRGRGRSRGRRPRLSRVRVAECVRRVSAYECVGVALCGLCHPPSRLHVVRGAASVAHMAVSTPIVSGRLTARATPYEERRPRHLYLGLDVPRR